MVADRAPADRPSRGVDSGRLVSPSLSGWGGAERRGSGAASGCEVTPADPSTCFPVSAGEGGEALLARGPERDGTVGPP